MNLVEQVKFAIAQAEAGRSKLGPDVLAIEGMSSPKVRHFLNNLLNFGSASYLEIGCWQGSTLISALFGNKRSNYWVIDNFCDYGSPREAFQHNFKRHIGGSANLIDADCFSFDPTDRGIIEVNVYFYDGWHSEEAQRKALTHYIRSLAQTFIYIVDDWNGPEGEPVRKGTAAAIKELGLEILFEQTMRGQGSDLKEWWNGLWIAVLRKSKKAAVAGS